MAGLGFGYLWDFRNPVQWQRPWDQIYAENLDLIAWSETAGFSGAWVPEHHGAEDGYLPAPNLALAAIAARTSTITIGAAVAIAPLHDPVRFAEECAVLDILSGGRLETGLGLGYRSREYAMYGRRFSQRGNRFDEFLQIVRRLWAGETVDFTGRHHTVTAARITPIPPHGRIPLYIGGFTDRALERAATYGDGYFGSDQAVEAYLAKLDAAGKSRAEAKIRIPGLFLTVAEDPEKAMAELGPHYHHVYSTYGAWMREDDAIGMDTPATRPLDLETFTRSGVLQILTPQQAIDYFTGLSRRIPLDHFTMMRPPGLPADRFIEYAQLFADTVIPAFR